MMYSDIKNFNYNPYVFEFAKLIREKKANKLKWFIIDKILKFIFKYRIFWWRYVKYVLRDLDLKEEELCIKNDIDIKDITSLK